MPAYDGRARVGLTLDHLGFGLFLVNGQAIPATHISIEVIPGEAARVVLTISATELRAALEAADLRLIIEEDGDSVASDDEESDNTNER